MFLAAAVSKISDLPGFENQILLHSGLPRPVGVAVVVVLPWLELTCGACFALGHAVREAALIASALLGAFAAYALVFRGEGDCHCFFLPVTVAGGAWWWAVARNGVLLLCGLWLVRRGD